MHKVFFVAWFLLSRLVPASMSSIKAGLPKRFCLNTLSTTTWPALCASSTCVRTFTRHHRNQAVCLLMGRVAFSYNYDPRAMLKRMIVTEKRTFFLYLKLGEISVHVMNQHFSSHHLKKTITKFFFLSIKAFSECTIHTVLYCFRWLQEGGEYWTEWAGKARERWYRVSAPVLPPRPRAPARTHQAQGMTNAWLYKYTTYYYTVITVILMALHRMLLFLKLILCACVFSIRCL